MKKLLLICSVPPGRNQRLLLFSAVAWCAVIGLEPLAWLPWSALAVAWPWFLWPLRGSAGVRLVAFPSALAFHMASTPPLETMDLFSVLFLFLAYIGFSLARPPALPVDFKPLPPQGEMRGLVPAAFLLWTGGSVFLMWLVDARAPWMLLTAVFCAAHFGVWRRLARAGSPVRGPLLTLAIGTLLFFALQGVILWSAGALFAGVTVALAVWTVGVGEIKIR